MLNDSILSQKQKGWCSEASEKTEKKIYNKQLLKTSILEYYAKCLKLDEINEFPTWAGKWAPRENNEVDRLCGMAKDLARLLFPDERQLSNSLKKYRKCENSLTFASDNSSFQHLSGCLNCDIPCDPPLFVFCKNCQLLTTTIF